ncbi:50S ribosomal protein L17 [Treponema rectale]|uniref:50S ribosomal protein L17 n=1 Tax=Treponema rectale TaxID=744512 RepID=A0A7M1XLB1_9SPIR|nr:50S ribosomal protein L17 [Treponema rectale]
MSTIGRRNVHGKGGVRFKAGYTSDKRKNMLRNVVSQLIISGQVEVTVTVAKRASQEADRLVTYAKKGDLAARRLAARFVREQGFVDPKTGKNALQKLFDVYGPKYKERNGGYTRVLKTYNRRGDNAPMAILAFVD